MAVLQDTRFTPIGGMFAGVRGTTVEGGDPIARDKLVRLNDQGVIAMSCLDNSIIDTINDIVDARFSRVEERLDIAEENIALEKEAREKLDVDLRTDFNNALSALRGYTDSNDIRLEGMITTLRRHTDSNDTRLEDMITALREDVDSNDNDIRRTIGNLSSRITSDLLEIKQQILLLKAIVAQLTGSTIEEEEAVNNLAPVFEKSSAYSAGDLVLYEGKLFRFKGYHAPGNAWDDTIVDQVTMGKVLGEVSSLLSNLHTVLQTLTGEV